MMPSHDHIETHRSLNEFLGGTLLGAVINAILGASVLLINIWINAKELDEWLTLGIKIGSIIVLYFSIKNGYLALKKNKSELKKIEDEQRANSKS